MFVTDNSYRSVKDYYHKSLSDIYKPEEINILFDMVIEDLLQLNKLSVKKLEPYHFKESELLELHFALKELKSGKPVQQITGRAYFYNNYFKVNEHTLIPRPETEELVHLILKQHSDKNKMLDIGTGSGCIAISLQSVLNNEVTAWDVSDEALAMAEKNNEALNTQVHFKKTDILQRELPSEKYDLIVSNPPYIKYSEKESMQKTVTDFEPALALFVADNDPLLFYRKIALWGKEHLNKEGVLLFEINQELGKEVKIYLEDLGYSNVTIYKDINNNDRMVEAYI